MQPAHVSLWLRPRQPLRVSRKARQSAHLPMYLEGGLAMFLLWVEQSTVRGA
jgi:hypothetical protein